jgi:hypothetical protein
MIAARPVTDFPEAIDAHFGGDCKGCGDNGRLDRETLDSNLSRAIHEIATANADPTWQALALAGRIRCSPVRGAGNA